MIVEPTQDQIARPLSFPEIAYDEATSSLLARQTVTCQELSMSLVEASYCEYVGTTLQSQQRELALRWLERLVALLPVEATAVFASSELLDHIPRLIEEIGKYVAAPDVADVAANTVVTERAQELGQLRHCQHASVHQVLREYELLAEVLEQFVDERTQSLPAPPAAHECLEASRRLGRAVRVAMQITVATFIREYTETITGQAERLEQFNRAVSHELRNVLGTVQFGAAVLANASTAETGHHERALTALRRNTDRALQILRSLERLPRSRIVTADTPTEQLVDLGELVTEVFRQLAEMAKARGVALRAPDALPRLYVDTGCVELILVNLVANAIKYSDPNKGDRFVEVTARTVTTGHEILVSDNGLGIPADALDSIFERFRRVHQALDATLGIDGTGLGLAIVDDCVKTLGGSIQVESEEGAGSTFILTLPGRTNPPTDVS